MERLAEHLVFELSRNNMLQLVAPQGATCRLPNVVVRQAPLRPLSRFLLVALWKTLREAVTGRPDIVFAGSGLTAPLAWLAARLTGARACSYVHGLDLTVPHPVYQALWLPIIRRLDVVIANSRATAEFALLAGVPAERITIIPPGVNLFPSDSEARTRFRTAHALEERKVLLSVGRLAARKGLREFVSDVLPLIVERRPETTLVIIGSIPQNALFSEVQTPESIQAAADLAGVGPNLLFLGSVAEGALQDAYEGSDLHIFPVKHRASDPEGFGMVAVEAASHGLATVAYACGGVVDAVGEGVSGHLVTPGDSAAFSAAVLELLDTPLDQTTIRSFAQQFAWPRFGERIEAAIKPASRRGET